MKRQYWLLKTEPGTYSFENLIKDGFTNWNGIRNYQARNFLKQMKKGDVALIYHSGDDKAVVGMAEIIREAYAEHDLEGGEWYQVDIKAGKRLASPVPLAVIKKTSELSELLLLKQSRLSVMPITEKQCEVLLSLNK